METWVNTREPWSRRKRILVFSSIAAAVFLVVALLGSVWLLRQLNPPGPEGQEVAVEIPVGASLNDITRILTDKDVVSNFTVTRFWWRNEGPYSPGTYTFRENMSVNSARRVLDAGPVVQVGFVTLPEGLWLSEIEQRLLARLPDFNRLELDAVLRGNLIRSKYQPENITSLEGLVFPDTYEVDSLGQNDEAGLVGRMVSQFDSVLDNLDYISTPQRVGYTPYEVVIIASMVEAEARVAEDRPKIARVIYNRLARGMRLEIDATVIYALGERRSQITATDLEVDSPYNTRRNTGLPPTPIAAPGRAALEAALNPAEGDWLFYVLQDRDGTHFFTSDFDAFLDQVRKSREEGIF